MTHTQGDGAVTGLERPKWRPRRAGGLSAADKLAERAAADAAASGALTGGTVADGHGASIPLPILAAATAAASAMGANPLSSGHGVVFVYLVMS